MNNDNQPVAEPITPETPTPVQPTVEPQTDPVAFPADSIVVGDKKSKKVPIIIGIVVGVLLIAAAVFGGLWAVNHNKPETVAMNAMSKFFGEKAVKATGSFDIELQGENDLGITNIKIRLDEASSSFLPSAVTGAVIFSTEEDEITLDIGAAIISDGTMYFQFSGITEVLEDALPAELSQLVSLFEDELSEFDGQWYEFDIVGMAALFDVDVDMDDYDCYASAIASLNSDKTRTALVNGYKEHPFILLEKTDKEKNEGKGYKVSADADKFTAFDKYLDKNTSLLEKLEDCPVDESDIDLDSITLPDFTLYITDWSHELKAVDIFYEDVSSIVNGSLNLTFPEPLDIKAHEDAKPFSGFLEDFITKFATLMTDDSQDTDTAQE